MPLTGSTVGENIAEFHKGNTYQRTEAKFGKKRADKQAIAVGYSATERNKKRGTKKSRIKSSRI